MSNHTSIISEVLLQYGISTHQVHSFGSGLINNTWRVQSGENAYILQRVNDNVFKQPEAIAANINLIAAFIQKYHKDYTFVTPMQTHSGSSMVKTVYGYYRLFPFVARSHTIDVVATPQQAKEAAKQFGLFTKTLENFEVEKLHITLAGFHDLTWRYQQFKEALQQGNRDRIQASQPEITSVQNNKSIVDTYNHLTTTGTLVQRVTHHDTKISNVLFDTADKGICVIDLDTVMPGYFISDVGDMMRTYLCPVSEEEKDLSLIEIRDTFFAAILQGYLTPMAEVLTTAEKKLFVYGGKFMIYMQALRFLTDYLNNDCYYGAAYEKHNLVRAQNQLVLLEKLKEKETVYTAMVDNFTADANNMALEKIE